METLEPRRMMSAEPGTISGVVFNDRNRNGVRDADETPLVGYRVFIDKNNDGVCNHNEAQRRAGINGRFNFFDMPAGGYTLVETTVETRMPTTPTAYHFSLRAGERVVRSFGNAGASISGCVFLDMNRDGAREVGEVGIASAHVYLDLDNDGTWDANEPIVRTSLTGRYRFDDVLAGTVRVRVFPIATMNFTAGSMRKIDLTAGAIVTRHFGVMPPVEQPHL